MLRTTSKTTRLALAFGLWAPTIFGCDIPVFRYALDRWPADAFRLEAPGSVLRTEPLATEIRNLTGRSGLNLETSVSTNGARLFYPLHVRGADKFAWEGQLSPEVYGALTDSPARRDLVKRILRGDSAVWVLVEGGPSAANEAAASLLENRLRFLESATGIPRLDPNDPDSRVGPGPELKVQLSLAQEQLADQGRAGPPDPPPGERPRPTVADTADGGVDSPALPFGAVTNDCVLPRPALADSRTEASSLPNRLWQTALALS